MHLVILGACEVAGGSAPGLALIMSKDLQACEATEETVPWSLGQDWRMPRRLAHLLHPCPWIAALFAAPCPSIALLRRWHWCQWWLGGDQVAILFRHLLAEFLFVTKKQVLKKRIWSFCQWWLGGDQFCSGTSWQTLLLSQRAGSAFVKDLVLWKTFRANAGIVFLSSPKQNNSTNVNFAGKWSWELFARKNTKTSLSLEPDSCGYGYALPACKIIIQSLFFIIVKFQMEMPKTIYACQLRAAMPGLPSSRWSVASEEAWLVIEPFQKCKFGKGHKTSSFVWRHNFCIQLKYSPHMTLMIRRNAYLKIFEM